MAFTCCVLYSRFLAPVIEMPPKKPCSLIIDSSPLVLFGGFCVWLVVCNIDPVVGLFALWTMGLPILLTLYSVLFVIKPNDKILDDDEDENDPDYLPPVAEDATVFQEPDFYAEHAIDDEEEEDAGDDDEDEEEDTNEPFMTLRRSPRLRKI